MTRPLIGKDKTPSDLFVLSRNFPGGAEEKLDEHHINRLNGRDLKPVPWSFVDHSTATSSLLTEVHFIFFLIFGLFRPFTSRQFVWLFASSFSFILSRHHHHHYYVKYRPIQTLSLYIVADEIISRATFWRVFIPLCIFWNRLVSAVSVSNLKIVLKNLHNACFYFEFLSGLTKPWISFGSYISLGVIL